MLNLSISCTRFERNYSSCKGTGRSSENLCNSSGGAQDKRKTGWNSGNHQNEFHPTLNANVLFCSLFLNLTLCMTPKKRRAGNPTKVFLLENIKQAKGNECRQYKRDATILSSSLPICPIHIFSSDTQACFPLVTSHNMPSTRLHNPLYP